MRVLDFIIKWSAWYKTQIEDANRIKKAPRGLDVINFGSNPAKYGLDYSQCNIKGYNLAVGPQTLEFDYKMLMNYSRLLDNNGKRILILVFCPFSCCKSIYTDHDGDVCKNIRYYGILDTDEITNFDYSLYEKKIVNPSKQGGAVWRKILSTIIHKPTGLNSDYNPLTPDQMKMSAKNMITSWMREFYLLDLTPEHLSHYVKDAIGFNKSILHRIMNYCKNHNIRPYMVLPPLSSELNDLIPDNFREACTYSVLRHEDAVVLDYSKDLRFCKHDLFVDALKLNKTGRLKFTNQVISDILANK